MRVSMQRVNITPAGTFYLMGYRNEIRQQPALGVHDVPYAILLMLDFPDETVLFVSIDVCALTRARTSDLRRQLSEATGVPEAHIIISSIHSHSCATAFCDGQAATKSHGYEGIVTGLCVEASTRLRDSLVEAHAEILKTRVHGWYGNRNDRCRPYDDEAYVLRFRDLDENVVGAMLNFNCHATVVGPLNRYLTPDIIGAVRADLAEWIGVMPYTFTGASGDLGNRQYRCGNDFAELARVGNGIAGEIMKGSFRSLALEAPKWTTFHADISYDNTKYHQRYRQKLNDVEAKLAGEISFDEEKLAGAERCALREQLGISEVAFPIDMETLDLGNLVFVTFPGELASDLGVRIKRMFRDRAAIIIGYANDYQGYFVPESDFGDSYEALVTKLPQGGIERVLRDYEEQR